MRVISSLVKLVAVARLVVAGPQFLQCTNSALLDALGDVVTPLESLSSFSLGLCGAACSAYNYSIFSPSIQSRGLIPKCYCTNSNPSIEYLIKGTSSDGRGECSVSPRSHHVYVNKVKKFQFTQCAIAILLDGATTTAVVADTFQCFNTCGGYRHMVMTPTSEGYSCECGGGIKFTGVAAKCNMGVGTLYTDNSRMLPRQSNNSGVDRRRAAALGARLAAPSYCPNSMTSCLVAGSTFEYECIDTDIELESCGGCRQGQYHAEGTSDDESRGVDCTNLPGVALGGVSCVNGGCQVLRCLTGWALNNNMCVRKVNLSNARRRAVY